jgi:hypothetical protein
VSCGAFLPYPVRLMLEQGSHVAKMRCPFPFYGRHNQRCI